MKLNVKSIIYQQERLNTRNNNPSNLNHADSKIATSKFSKGTFLNNRDDENYYLKNEEIYRRGAFSLSPKRNSEFLLPHQKISNIKQKTLVLDLDETLIHSTFDKVSNPDLVFTIEIEGNFYQINVMVRPGAEEFLIEMSQYYELVIYTASVSKYADPVISLIDKQKTVSHRLFREHCTHFDGNYIKDLGKLGRDLKGVLIIDNCPESYYFNPNNGIPIKSWYDDKQDKELFKLKDVLIYLNNSFDVRGEIIKLVHDNKLNYDIFHSFENAKNLKKSKKSFEKIHQKRNPSISIDKEDSLELQNKKNNSKNKNINFFKQNSNGKKIFSLVTTNNNGNKVINSSFLTRVSDLKKFNSNKIQKNYNSISNVSKKPTSLKKPEFCIKSKKRLTYDLNSTSNYSHLETTANNNTLNKTAQTILKNHNQSVEVKSGESSLQIVKPIFNSGAQKETFNSQLKQTNKVKKQLISRNEFPSKSPKTNYLINSKEICEINEIENFETQENNFKKKTHVKQYSMNGIIKPLMNKIKIKSPPDSNNKIENEILIKKHPKTKNKSYDFKNCEFETRNNNLTLHKSLEKSNNFKSEDKNVILDKKFYKYAKIKRINLEENENNHNPVYKYKNELIDNPILINNILRSSNYGSREETPNLKCSHSVIQKEKLAKNYISINNECNSPENQKTKNLKLPNSYQKQEKILSLKKFMNKKSE